MTEENPDARQPALWVPMTNPRHLKILGKLTEELGEATAAVSRCIIQGIAAAEPTTGKPNRQWLEDELADVLANIDLTIAEFELDAARIGRREDRKKRFLRLWHEALTSAPPESGTVRAPGVDDNACRPPHSSRRA